MPEQPWTPPRYISLADAFNMLGRARFKGEWTGTDLSARPEHRIPIAKTDDERKDDAWKEEKRKTEISRKAKKASVRVFSGPKDYRNPPTRRPAPQAQTITVEERQEELDARKRLVAVSNEMRDAMYEGKLPIGRLSDDENAPPGDPNYWRRVNAESIFKRMGAFNAAAAAQLLVPKALVRQLIDGTLGNGIEGGSEAKQTRRERGKAETAAKHQGWFDLSQELKVKHSPVGPEELSRLVGRQCDVNPETVRRILDSKFKGWAK